MMTEQRIAELQFNSTSYLTSAEQEEVFGTIRRLQQREIDLQTALNLNEGLVRELTEEAEAAELALNYVLAEAGTPHIVPARQGFARMAQ